MGLRLYSEFHSSTDKLFKIEIHDTSFSGTAEAFTVASDGFTLNYSGETDDIVSPIIGSNCTISAYNNSDAFDTFINALKSYQEERFYVRIYAEAASIEDGLVMSYYDTELPPDNGLVLYWAGVIMQDLVTVEDTHKPYVFSITAVDGIGHLSNKEYTNVNNTTLEEFIESAVNAIGLDALYANDDLYYATSVNIWDTQHTYNATTDVTTLTRFSALVYSNKEEDGTVTYSNYLEVLKELCTAFGARFYQREGVYYFEQYIERTDTSRNVSAYYKNGTKAFTSTVSDDVTLDGTTGGGARLAGNQFNFLPANFQSTFYWAHGLSEVNIGSNVDMSSAVDFNDMFRLINYSTAASTFTNVTFPTNADFSSLTSLSRTFEDFSGNPIMSVCQTDNFIRRSKATNNNSNLTVNFYANKVTEAPSVVRSDVDYLENTKGWNITLATPDATLPFAYASYAVDPTGITTISPTTTPPAGSVFTATNSLSINSSTGVITINSFRGGTTIRCTYPDGCYNEVVMLIQVPFKMNITIPAGSTNFELKPQMSAGECFIDWGDSNSQTLTANTTHSYASSGSNQTYPIRIFDSPSGSKFTGFNSSWNVTSGGYVDDIAQWGEIEWQNNKWFANTSKSTITATDTPNLSQVTSLQQMFSSNGINSTFSGGSAISNWNVSTITNMSSMFWKVGSANFTQNLSNWDVSNVTTLQRFNYTYPEYLNYNQNWVADWGNKTSKVEDFSYFMYGGKSNSIAVNSNMGNYNTSSATNMSYMFFNNGGDIANCKTKIVNAGQADEYIAWDVKKVENFSYMFAGGGGRFVSTEFPDNWYISGNNQDINMQNMFGWFYGGGSLNNITDVNSFATKTISASTSPYGTQYTAWDMSNTTNLVGFAQTNNTNQLNWNINTWQISNKLTSFASAFGVRSTNINWAYTLDQDLGHWDISNVTSATNSWFNNYTSYNPTPTGFSVNFSTANLDSIYDITDGWGQDAGSVQSGVNLNMGTSQYTATNVVQGTCNNTGTNSTTCADYANSPFVTAGVQVGDIAYNVTTGQYSKVLSIVFTGTGITTDQAIWSNGDIYRVERSNAVKGRYALIEAGWTITDGGLYVPPITPLKFNVDVTASTTNANLEFQIPFITGTNFSINWGDTNTDTGLSRGNSSVTHTYPSAGTYSIEIGQAGDAGPPTKIAFGPTNGEVNNSSTPGNGAKAVTEITQWGSIQWTDVVSMWCGCLNLDTMSATDTPDLSNVGGADGTKFMFGAMRLRDGFDAPSLSTVNSSISNWDVSGVRNFSYTFNRCNSFNVNINNWDISGIDQSTGLVSMFSGARLFNQPLNNWTLPSAVTSLANMFSAHDTTNGFNQDIGSWNVSNITNMSSMFSSNGAFTGINLENWERTTAGNVSTVGNVTTMSGMFYYGYGLANTAISNWDTSKVTNFASMFGRWGYPTASNPQIDVGNIVKYWDTSSATNFDSFFTENRAINQNLGSLDITSLTRGIGMFYRSNLMSDANYTDTIVGWANFVKNQTPDAPLNVLFSNQQQVSFESARSGGANFTNAAEARTFLTDTVASGGAGWTINGDTVIPLPFTPFKFKVSVPAATSTVITVPYVTGTDYTVNWGDGSEDNSLNTSNAAVTHTYDGTVTNPEISFGKTGDTGLPTRISFNKAGSKAAVTEITQWGNLQLTSLNYQFRECTNLTTISATDLPDWSQVTDSVGMYLMFNDAPLNSVHSSMANWDVSMMRSFNQCFGDSSGLNIDLSGWDISGVDQASGFQNMFNGCSSLNFDAGQWTLPTHRSDYNLSGMFGNCTSFNQDLSSWDILNRVTSLSSTFADRKSVV